MKKLLSLLLILISSGSLYAMKRPATNFPDDYQKTSKIYKTGPKNSHEIWITNSTLPVEIQAEIILYNLCSILREYSFIELLAEIKRYQLVSKSYIHVPHLLIVNGLLKRLCDYNNEINALYLNNHQNLISNIPISTYNFASIILKKYCPQLVNNPNKYIEDILKIKKANVDSITKEFEERLNSHIFLPHYIPNKNTINQACVYTRRGANITALSNILFRRIYSGEENFERNLQQLIAMGGSIDFNRQDKLGNTVLMKSVRDKQSAIVHVLCQYGVNPNIPNRNGLTSLMVAAYRGFGEKVKAILAVNPDLNREDAVGYTALMHAVDANRPSTSKAIIQNIAQQANVNYQNARGENALMFLVQTGHEINTLRILLENGADINAQNNKGQTALIIALEHGHLSLARELIRQHADTTIEDKKGNTALSLARQNNITDMVHFIEHNREPIQTMPHYYMTEWVLENYSKNSH